MVAPGHLSVWAALQARAQLEVARLRALPVTDPWADFEEEEE